MLSPTTVPKAGNKLLEIEARFLISPLECRRNSSGVGDLMSAVNGDLPSDADISFIFDKNKIGTWESNKWGGLSFVCVYIYSIYLYVGLAMYFVYFEFCGSGAHERYINYIYNIC